MTEQVPAPTSTAAARYELLKTERQHFIDRADKAAKLTIPTLFQQNVLASQNLKIKDPAQSVGTRGVNTMSAKMTVSLFPMNTPFFKLNLDEILDEDADPELKREVKKGLAKLEKQALKDIENSGDVVLLHEVVKHLLVVGNVLIFVGKDGLRLYNLNKFVVLRDPAGKVKEIVICEEVMPDSLDEDFIAQIEANGHQINGGTERTIKLYTHVFFKENRVVWHQEVLGNRVPGSDGDVPEDGNPWLALRYIPVDGESYGRSHVEQYMGDLTSLEILTKAVNEASAAAAKVLFLVRPNGSTSAKVIAQAPNMAVRTGNAEDVTVLRLDKTADLRVAKEMIDEITRRLAHAFMLRTEVMRDAERVTAEEVRIVARELDEANGGIYSMLSKELQLPYVKRRFHLMRKTKSIKKLPDGVDLAIVTGFAALGRGHDSDALMRFIEKVSAAAQAAQALGGKINIDVLIERIALAEGIDTTDLIVSQEAFAAQQEQAQGERLLETMGPELIKQAGPALMQQQVEGSQDGSTPQTQG